MKHLNNMAIKEHVHPMWNQLKVPSLIQISMTETNANGVQDQAQMDETGMLQNNQRVEMKGRNTNICQHNPSII